MSDNEQFLNPWPTETLYIYLPYTIRHTVEISNSILSY